MFSFGVTARIGVFGRSREIRVTVAPLVVKPTMAAALIECARFAEAAATACRGDGSARIGTASMSGR
ncbi:hypothetical protein D3C87_1794310 [compost metagenome]